MPRETVQQQQVLLAQPGPGRELTYHPLGYHELIVLQQAPGLEYLANNTGGHSVDTQIPAHHAPNPGTEIEMNAPSAGEAIPLQQLAQGRLPRPRTANKQDCLRSDHFPNTFLGGPARVC